MKRLVLVVAMMAGQARADVVPPDPIAPMVWLTTTANCADIQALNMETDAGPRDAEARGVFWGFLEGVSVPYGQNAAFAHQVYQLVCTGHPEQLFFTGFMQAIHGSP